MVFSDESLCSYGRLLALQRQLDQPLQNVCHKCDFSQVTLQEYQDKCAMQSTGGGSPWSSFASLMQVGNGKSSLNLLKNVHQINLLLQMNLIGPSSAPLASPKDPDHIEADHPADRNSKKLHSWSSESSRLDFPRALQRTSFCNGLMEALSLAGPSLTSKKRGHCDPQRPEKPPMLWRFVHFCPINSISMSSVFSIRLNLQEDSIMEQALHSKYLVRRQALLLTLHGPFSKVHLAKSHTQ